MDFDGKEKVIAFHLPQFHTFKENDEWWGKGFTEWTNVRKTKPLFKGHNQPRVPLNNNYYDLSKLESLLWQMKLAKKYGVDAFCYYHYWFDGKLLLEKPIEMIRDYQGKKLEYCLCWANEPWTRSWDGNERSVLMPQRYGEEMDWKKHFKYLLTYFKDPYYIKINNRPMLVLYRCNNIPNCDDMIRCWDECCKTEGFAGIYVVEELNGFQNHPACVNSKAYLDFEPMNTVVNHRTFTERIMDKMRTKLYNSRFHIDCAYVYKYSMIWHNILRRPYHALSGKEHFLGGYVGWDNSPRRATKASIHIGTSPEKFGRYLRRQRLRARTYNSRFIFINAWNEWGEGAYLEPDTLHKNHYLKAVKWSNEEQK